jgi:hypothetical protein
VAVDAAAKPTLATQQQGGGTIVREPPAPEGHVELAAPSLGAPVSNAEAVVRTQILPGAKRCYEDGLKSDPSQSGTLVLRIKVAPDGRVESVDAEGITGLSEQVVSCIVTVAKRVRFDAPGGNGATITVPFRFSK